MSDPLISRHELAETHPSGQRVVIYQSQTKDSIVLNPTGSWLWKRLESPQRKSELIKALCTEHPEVPEETISKDLSAYIDELSENQILLAQD